MKPTLPTLAGLLLFFSASGATAANVDQMIALGRQELANHSLLAANQWFSNAVVQAPSHETANALLAITRMATLSEDPRIAGFMDYLGIESAGRDPYNWTAQPTLDTNGNPVLPAGLTSTQAIALIRFRVLPAITASLGNLAQVKSENFTLSLSAVETKTVDVVVDYGDVQLARVGLHLAEFICYTLNVHNLNVNADRIREMADNDQLTFESLLSAYPDLLTYNSRGDLLLSKVALQNAITRYAPASVFIRTRQPGTTRLFNLTGDDVNKEADFRTNVLKTIKASLSGPVRVSNEADHRETLYIGAYFKGTRSLRSLLPVFDGDNIVAGTLPDPTFGGIIGGVTRANWESLVAENSLLTNRADRVKPLILIKSPTPGATFMLPDIMVQGTATDAAGVDRVEYQVNGGVFERADGAATWLAQVHLDPGQNTVRARSVDMNGNQSLLATRTFTYVPSDHLVLETNGNGRVTGPANDTLLAVGKRFTWVAKAHPDWLFYNWSGSVNSTAPVLSTTMQSNMMLIASFVPNPFIPVLGVYNGLFQPEESIVSPTNSGFFTLTLSKPGTFSGKLLLGGAVLPFTGKFGLDGLAFVSAKPSGKPRQDLRLTIDPAIGTLSGSVSNAAGVSQIVAFRAGPVAGALATSDKFTFTIPPGTNEPPIGPGGFAAGKGTLKSQSRFTLSATLADGSVISQSASASADGRFPFYASLYGGGGVILGWTQFASEPNHATIVVTSESIRWIKTPRQRDTLYPGGFNGNLHFKGARFVTPAAAVNILPWGSGRILARGGNLTTELSNGALLQPTKVVFAYGNGNPNKFTLTFSRGDGTITGSFWHPIAKRTASFKGVFLQAPYNYAASWFRGTNATGEVTLFEDGTPPPVHGVITTMRIIDATYALVANSPPTAIRPPGQPIPSGDEIHMELLRTIQQSGRHTGPPLQPVRIEPLIDDGR